MDKIEDASAIDAGYRIKTLFDWLDNKDSRNSKICFDNFVTY